MHDRSAPAGVVIAKVTASVLPTTVLPPRSCTATTGWVANATPPVDPLGCVVKPSLAAAPAVMVKLLLVAAVRMPSVPVSV